MGNLQKKCRTTGKKSLAYRGKSGQNTGNDFLALGLGVVLYLPMSGVAAVAPREETTEASGSAAASAGARGMARSSGAEQRMLASVEPPARAPAVLALDVRSCATGVSGPPVTGRPRGPNDQKSLISIEIFDLDRNF